MARPGGYEGRKDTAVNRYFYTFGSDPAFPYQNGWVGIHAASREDADYKFRARFPDRPGHEGMKKAKKSTGAKKEKAEAPAKTTEKKPTTKKPAAKKPTAKPEAKADQTTSGAEVKENPAA